MRLVHSVPIWLPLTQTWIYNQVKQLQLLGELAHVVCTSTTNLEHFSLANIHSLSSDSIYLRIMERILRKTGRFHQLNYLSRISRKTRADIIHSHFGPTAWNNLPTARKLKASHVVTFYGFDVHQLLIQVPIWRERYMQLFDEVNLVLCEGTHMGASLVTLGCPERKVRVQHIGVNVDEIFFQPRAWRKGQPLRVLIAASFREKKGIRYAIEALHIVAKDVPLQLTIIGDAGPSIEQQQEKSLIYSILNRTGMKKHTKMMGYQSHQSLMTEAYDHHIFLQPSVTAQDGDTEGGAPVSILEILASGMPVISTDHCDIPEVMGPAFSHLLSPERDVEKLVEKINLLLDDPESWADLVLKGRKHIESEYNLFRQAKRLIGHYNKIL